MNIWGVILGHGTRPNDYECKSPLALALSGGLGLSPGCVCRGEFYFRPSSMTSTSFISTARWRYKSITACGSDNQQWLHNPPEHPLSEAAKRGDFQSPSQTIIIKVQK